MEGQDDGFAHYKRQMGIAIDSVHTLIACQDWELVDPASPEETVQLFTRTVADGGAGYFFVLTKSMFYGRPERLMHVVCDQDPATRLPWDESVKTTEKVECFHADEGTIHVVHSEIISPIPLSSNRSSLGIYWRGFDRKLQTHKMVFTTTSHRFFAVPPNLVPIEGYGGAIIRSLGQHFPGENLFASSGGEDVTAPGLRKPSPQYACEFITVSCFNPGGNLPNALIEMYLERVRARIHLYERVAGRDWDTYYKGRDPKKNRNTNV